MFLARLVDSSGGICSPRRSVGWLHVYFVRGFRVPLRLDHKVQSNPYQLEKHPKRSRTEISVYVHRPRIVRLVSGSAEIFCPWMFRHFRGVSCVRRTGGDSTMRFTYTVSVRLPKRPEVRFTTRSGAVFAR